MNSFDNLTLIKNAAMIVTMDSERRELQHHDILVQDGVIAAIGENITPPDNADIIHAENHIVTPGLINTHHHLYQSLTRAIPACQDAFLFGWLQTLYPIWGRMNGDDIFTATQAGLAELALSGCSLTSDHLYIFPNGARLDDSIHAAETIGIRLLATRGAMSIGQSKGGLPPDRLVEDEADILRDCERVINQYHQPDAGAMIQIGVAPCSPFSVSRELMRDAAILAREHKVRLHTHLAENQEDIDYSLASFNCLPGEYAESLGWVGADVWHAHCVKLNDDEIKLFAKTGTGIAHCPCSNCRLGSGILPLRTMLNAGVNIGLGVDGSASSDAAHLLNEARQAMLLQRVQYGADAVSAREILEIATLGGAKILGRDDLGAIAVGKRADIALWKKDTIATIGAWDAVASLIFCGPHQVDTLLVEGKLVVQAGRLCKTDETRIIEAGKKSLKRLMDD